MWLSAHLTNGQTGYVSAGRTNARLVNRRGRAYDFWKLVADAFSKRSGVLSTNFEKS